MRRIVTTLLVITLMFSCAGIVQAETHEHWWSLWDYFRSDTKYHYGQRHCYECGRVETKQEEHALMPYPSYYSEDGETCYACYTCRICYETVKVATDHKWRTKIGQWTRFSDDKHMRTVERNCSQCKTLDFDMEYEDHNLGFHQTTYKGKPALYWGCDICHYNYDGYVYPKTRTSKNSIKLSQYMTKTIPLPHTDKIKSIKITSGKNKIKVKKLSYNRIKITPKKKGTAKFKITTSAGLVFTNTVKVKKR